MDVWEEFVAFAAAATRARLPLKAAWHPGDAAWLIKDSAGPPPVKLLRRDGVVVAAISFQDESEVWIEALSDPDFVLAVEWAEAKSAPLAIRMLDRDGMRAAHLKARGYARAAAADICFAYPLVGPMPTPLLADGMRIRDCVDVDAEARAACHRDAWSHLEHLGIYGSGSKFSAETYRRLRDGPCYDPTLDLMVECADGRLVANCVAWIDPSSGVGAFEPFGTHVDFRGRGLARALAHDGMRRMQARGMTLARVSTAHFNQSAAKAYLRAGFRQTDRWSWWRKR